MYVHFFPTPNCIDHQVSCSGIFIQYYYAYSYCVGPLANAGIKYKASNDVIFIPCAKEEKYLNLRSINTSYLFMTTAFRQNKKDISYFKLDDTLNEKIRTKPTTPSCR